MVAISRSARRLAVPALVVALLLLPGASVRAQSDEKFTNLKVLPQDITKRELMSIMRSFSIALGTRCEHCHVERRTGVGEELDFASDDLEPKRVARVMLAMTEEINSKLLPKTGRHELTRVRCVTCHHGLTKPETISSAVLAAADKGGIDAGIRRYRELREEYYGSAAYDFSPDGLGQIADTLARDRSDLDGALAVVRLNIELHPDNVNAHLMLGQILAQKGDRDGAVAAIEKALALDPDNRWAKRLLQQVRGAEPGRQ